MKRQHSTSMTTAFTAPAAVLKNRDARPYLDPSFGQRAGDRLGFGKA